MNAFDFFKNDHFAARTGIELTEISEGHAKARLIINETHINAAGTTQGGAIFTLADFVMAAASNSHGQMALAINGSINFLRGSIPGDVLYAEAKERSLHKRLATYQIDVTNQKEELIATFEGTVYRKDIATDLQV
jgi:acyl-CoA thioesterase